VKLGSVAGRCCPVAGSCWFPRLLAVWTLFCRPLTKGIALKHALVWMSLASAFKHFSCWFSLRCAQNCRSPAFEQTSFASRHLNLSANRFGMWKFYFPFMLPVQLREDNWNQLCHVMQIVCWSQLECIICGLQWHCIFKEFLLLKGQRGAHCSLTLKASKNWQMPSLMRSLNWKENCSLESNPNRA